jgi:two-component system sensor kinase FixL
MGEVAAGLAHELNQPLAASANFLGAAELLLAGTAEGERAADLLKLSNTQILRAGEIIRRLRDFIANGDTEMRVEPLEEAVREAVALGLIGSHHFDVRADYDLAPDATLMIADRIQIQQVLVNLLRNAAEAVREVPPERRVIRVGARAVGDEMLEISVADDGPGLPDEVLSNLYTPFITTKGKSGLGVGLSICRRIIEAHGGAMTAVNQPEQGARIAFTVPRPAGDNPIGGGDG